MGADKDIYAKPPLVPLSIKKKMTETGFYLQQLTLILVMHMLIIVRIKKKKLF
jgi:hypothetical protein